jgi:hypothetical protein
MVDVYSPGRELGGENTVPFPNSFLDEIKARYQN